jgi:hypothetical protein
MEIRKIFRNGLVLMALSMPLALTGCYNAQPKQTSQDQTQEEKYFQVEAKLRDSERKLEEKTKDYSALEKEKGIIVDERDKLVHERREYPRNTPEDVTNLTSPVNL